MTDYLPLLSRAITGLERNTGEARREVYDRARQALMNQLKTMNPPLAEGEITRERLALEEAIRRVETQSGRAEVNDLRARQAARSPTAPRTPITPPLPPVAPPQRRQAPGTATGARGAPKAATEPPFADAAMAGHPSPDAAVGEMTTAAFEFEQPARPAARSGRGVEGGRAAEEQGPGEPQPRPFRPRSADFARADARKALKAQLIVAVIVVCLVAVAALIGYVHRDRVLALIGIGSPATRSVTAGGEDRSKVADRVEPDQRQQGRPATTAPAPAGSIAAVAQRAVLYEENPSGGQQMQTYVGTAVWRTETVSPGPGRPPETGLRLEIEIPDRRLTVTLTMRRNPDESLPASHTIEVQFAAPGDPFGGIANMPGIRAKSSETAQGAPLAGLVARVMPGYFLIGLSAVDVDRERNLSMLRERSWLDIPFVYNNGRRAVLVVEKGTPGERAMNEVVAAWGG
jgi:hypothetical protein